MLRANGYGVIIGPDGNQENDVVTCVHCSRIEMVRPGVGKPLSVLVYRANGTHYLKEAGFCRNCMAPICPACDGKPCNNRFRQLDEDEKRARQMSKEWL